MTIERVYTVSFAATAETGAVDWFELATGSTGMIVLMKLFISQTTEFGDAQDEMIGWTIKRATGSYTSGSGGNTSVARPSVKPGSASATFTAETLNTTQIAAGSGTLTTIHQDAFNVRAGLPLIWTPETLIGIAPSSALAIGMTASPADSISWIGTAYVGELSP